MKDSEIAQYMSRIGLDKCEASLAGLKKLQEIHLQAIPFENLDIVVGREIHLELDHLIEKVLVKKRGGYCFELNLLYAELLRSLGFAPRPVLGRVWLSNPKKIPPRNHLAHLLELEGRTYITDVGFGGLITRIPLDINVGAPISDGDGMVKIVHLAGKQFMIMRETEKGWTKLYSFEDVDISDEDIRIANYYMSTNPNSHFYYHKFAGKNTQDGRKGLFNNKMSIRKGIKVIDKKKVDYGDDWLRTIKEEFSLNLDFTQRELNILFKKEEEK